MPQSFDTTRPANPLFCHQDFLDKLAEHHRDPMGRRVGFLMQRLAVDIARLHYKSTSGANRGWRRSRLGGGSGSHFYAWWAPKDAPPFKGYDDFASAPEGALILRDIRHHDDHSPVTPQSLTDHYLPITISDLRGEQYAPSPWSQPQERFATARQPVRILKGHPGSGKTTALWHAADATGAQHVLYVTYSSDLAGLARTHFERYCSAEKRFHVVTFPNLVREILGDHEPPSSERESRRAFFRDIVPFLRSTGVWSGAQAALYDEFHAHLIGDALPEKIARFASCKQPRVPDAIYRERRSRYIGQYAANSATELAARLERLDSVSIAQRYFPELALAWRAVEKLRGTLNTGSANFVREFDCIAVDECQDLTPIETLLVIYMAMLANSSRHGSVPLLLAGDEAQTVRPTDFEWGWLSDLLHAKVGTPAEYHLKSNLRSPRRLAELVNRVWDLYSHLHKHERPSGTGYAEIDDDATDQILYCSAAPGAELNELLTALAAREGLALITLDEVVPSWIPESVRPAVLTAAEAKGLDFHSVCVLDAGKHMVRITRHDDRVRSDSEIDGLYKRLAIDQLRVAISRATERLIWLDINPTEIGVHDSLEFLNGDENLRDVSSCVPTAVLKTLEEEQLDIEERIQRCLADARQYIGVRPEMAWSRAMQAITLLGPVEGAASVNDMSVRDQANLTVSEICFALACRRARMPAELGNPDLFSEARIGAMHTRNARLTNAISAVHQVENQYMDYSRKSNLVELARILPQYQEHLPSWFMAEVQPLSARWIEELEAALGGGEHTAELVKVMPDFYRTLGIADGPARTAKLQQKATQAFIRDKQYGAALAILRELPERQPKQEAVCYEALGDFQRAAEAYRAAGDVKSAIACYRSVPNLEAALALLPEMRENHPAKESLEWMARMQKVIAERPDKFNRVVTPAEKKLLEEMLERGLGVSRKAIAKKAATKKTATKKTATPRKRLPRPEELF